MYESELVNDFLRNEKLFMELIDPFSKGRRKFTLTEFDSKFGVADIVLGVFKKNVHISSAPHINPNWLYSLNSLSKGEEFTLSDFVNKFSISKQLSKKILNHFENTGYVYSSNKDIFVKKKDILPAVEKVISIEAKINDWRKAIKQAYRYKRFSSQSFVLLPKGKERQAIINIKDFQKYNVGLVTLGKEGPVIHHTPKILSNIKLNALARVNEFAIRRYQGGRVF